MVAEFQDVESFDASGFGLDGYSVSLEDAQDFVIDAKEARIYAKVLQKQPAGQLVLF